MHRRYVRNNRFERVNRVCAAAQIPEQQRIPVCTVRQTFTHFSFEVLSGFTVDTLRRAAAAVATLRARGFRFRPRFIALRYREVSVLRRADSPEYVRLHRM